MTDNAKKISQFPVANGVSSVDSVVLSANTVGSPIAKIVSVPKFAATLSFSNAAPATSSSNGTPGTIRYDNTYVYVCTANNTWMRSLLTTW